MRAKRSTIGRNSPVDCFVREWQSRRALPVAEEARRSLMPSSTGCERNVSRQTLTTNGNPILRTKSLPKYRQGLLVYFAILFLIAFVACSTTQNTKQTIIPIKSDCRTSYSVIAFSISKTVTVISSGFAIMVSAG